ncbi:substrate-binding periplasmic protein [Neptuniibacter halophilus]|uniref:substrate-binding periplasmic protein n=1 Tax=Neptuniibacter halophilus TaxID=651666 RepID=UPI0025740F80|nr:transporter substrate-binding domain-containing protein [Neptuniibacter halophilus]
MVVVLSHPFIIAFVLVVALMTGSAVAADKAVEVILYGDDNYPPYSYSEDGEARGIYADIILEAGQRMPGFRLSLKTVPWKRGLLMLQQGTAFALYPPYKHSSENRPYIDAYSLPILEETVVVYCREEVISSRELNRWPEDFYGLVIGRNAGFLLGGDAYRAAIQQGLIWEKNAHGNRVNILAMKMGRNDCYINDRISILMELQRLEDEGPPEVDYQRVFEVIEVSREHGYLAFTGRDKGRFYYKQAFLAGFNAAIRQMQEEGRLQSIIERHIRQAP